MKDYRIVPVGDTAVSVEFENEISPECNGKVSALANAVKAAGKKEITDVNPTYRAVLISYNQEKTDYRHVCKLVEKLMKKQGEKGSREAKVYLIPVCYGGEYGPDLKDVAEHAGITEEEVVKIHTGTDYLIYMLGFLPGFSYLGGMDAKLATPRLQQPREIIPAGSVGIGGSQTGIYPLDSPGGWRLIGRTPVRPYNAKEESILYAAGDYIRFCPVTEEEYEKIGKDIEAGTYTVPFERKAVQ